MLREFLRVMAEIQVKLEHNFFWQYKHWVKGLLMATFIPIFFQFILLRFRATSEFLGRELISSILQQKAVKALQKS